MSGNDFNWALSQLANGKEVTRTEWCNDITGVPLAKLTWPKPATDQDEIQLVTGSIHSKLVCNNWIASDADLNATDWNLV